MDIHFERDAGEVIANLGQANQRFANKTILLTGAAGFLGAHFVHYFAKLNRDAKPGEGCRLIAQDNFLRGVPDWLEDIRQGHGVEVEQRDVTAPGEFAAADFIIHAASIASPIYYRKYPLETMDANVNGLRQLLEHTRHKKVESLLYFSTSEIYGDPDPAFIPTEETYRGFVSCTGPRACYDESKRYGETLCTVFQAVHGIPVKIARPFNNYGPGLKISDRRVLPDFFRDVFAGRNIRLLSDGRATRTFCYISDAISGYLLALLSSHEGEPFNIGTEEPEVSMRELAAQVIQTSGRPDLKVEFETSDDPKYLTDNPQRRCPNIGKARRMLGYAPKIGLEEGLRRMYAYYTDHPEGSDA